MLYSLALFKCLCLVVIPPYLIWMRRGMAHSAFLHPLTIQPPKLPLTGPTGGLATPISGFYPPAFYSSDAWGKVGISPIPIAALDQRWDIFLSPRTVGDQRK